MEKARLGFQMTTRWSDPAITFIAIVLFAVPAFLISSIYVAFKFGIIYTVIMSASAYYYLAIYMPTTTGAADTEKYLTFDRKAHPKFASAWSKRKIPICTLVEGYLDGCFDFKDGDVFKQLDENRQQFITWTFTFSDLVFLLKQLIPGISSSFYDKATSKREIADHYDRHTDFFAAFLGKSMVYTCAIFQDHKTESLEDAQNRKLDTICRKMKMKAGDKHLDIGCGWGTLVRRAETKFGATTTGVTLSTEGANWCRKCNEKEGTKGKILEMDYRDIPDERFQCISAIEMAEHVGLTNFQPFLHQVKKMLNDDGVFLMQVAGLRQGANWEDISWGLFMSRYIFPGADASTPLHWYVHQLELAGFEVRSVETIGKNYSHTLYRWYLNFMKDSPSLDSKQYPDRLVRLWKIFLAWSTVASGQGSATCYQLAVHKNTSSFDRNCFVGRDVYDYPVQ